MEDEKMAEADRLKSANEMIRKVEEQISSLASTVTMMALGLEMVPMLAKDNLDIQAEVRILKRRMIREIDTAKDGALKMFKLSDEKPTPSASENREAH